MDKFERDRTTSSNIINYSTLNDEHDWEDYVTFSLEINPKKNSTSNNCSWIKVCPIFNPIFPDASS